MDDAKFDDLERYQTSEHFSEAERAALDFSGELTQDRKASPEQFKRLSRHFNERQICEILWLVATEHVYNITNIGLNIHSDQLCILAKQSRK
jgi:alkylhydroperoxidase family enzyme